MKRSIITLILAGFVVTAAVAGEAYVPTDAERARWTLHDMRSWKIALEAYHIDNKSYPAAATLQEAASAVEGKYISKVPMHDAWGRPYLYEKTDSGYVLVSAGADGRFDRASWSTPQQLDSLDADAVVTHEGKFWLRSWRFR